MAALHWLSRRFGESLVVPADTVVGPMRTTVYDFDKLPGTTLAHRVNVLVKTAASPASLQVNARIVVPSPILETVERSDALICALGFNSVTSGRFAKPTGIKRVTYTAQMTVAGRAGSAADLLGTCELESDAVTKLWELSLIPGAAGYAWDMIGVGVAHEAQPNGLIAAGGRIATFDFSQVPLYSTMRIIMAGLCGGLSTASVFRVRICDVADRNNVAGQAILAGSFFSPAAVAFAPFSAQASFTNTWTGVKLLKLTGYNTMPVSVGGFAAPSFVLVY